MSRKIYEEVNIYGIIFFFVTARPSGTSASQRRRSVAMRLSAVIGLYDSRAGRRVSVVQQCRRPATGTRISVSGFGNVLQGHATIVHDDIRRTAVSVVVPPTDFAGHRTRS